MTGPSVITPACAHLPEQEHAPRASSCGACSHSLGIHGGYPSETSCADWHSELPETPCDLCGCTWAEEPRPYPRRPVRRLA